MIQLIEFLLDLAASAAGAAIGLTAVIVWTYRRQWGRVPSSARLIPAHVTLVGVSYTLLSMVLLTLLVRAEGAQVLSNVAYVGLLVLVTLGFVIGDVALVLVLKFIRSRDMRMVDGQAGRRWYDRVHQHQRHSSEGS